MGKMMKKFTKREERIKRKAKKKAEIMRETLENLGYDLESLIDGTAKVSERANFAGTLDLSEQKDSRSNESCYPQALQTPKMEGLAAIPGIR